jgi:hypothetical protein
MNEIVQIIIIVLVSLASLAAFFNVLQAFFPRRFELTLSLARRSPVRSFWIGLVNFTFFAILGLAFFTLGDRTNSNLLRLPGAALAVFLSIGLSMGLGGAAGLVAERLLPKLNGFWKLSWGGIILALGCALPFAGWFLLLPYAGLMGFGAWIGSFFVRSLPEEG